MSTRDNQCLTDNRRLPLSLGATVRGIRFEYKVLSELGKGGRGHAFLVKATKSLSKDKTLPGKDCVLKTVRVDERRSPDEVFAFVGHVHELLVREFRALRRLRDLPCVPEVYDFGLFGFNLTPSIHNATEETVPLMFIVREHVEGQQLDEFLRCQFGKTTGDDALQFCGISDQHEWFRLARDLGSALFQIQQREVVHRDIWHENILVDSKAIRFIDFGDAYFRQEPATERPNERSDPFVAPEIRIGSRWPSRRADIYSMGGVLFYMATGTLPPNPPINNDDELKQFVTKSICDRNPNLLRANHGVADIIARCLRSDHHKRIKDAEMLLGELRLFDIESD